MFTIEEIPSYIPEYRDNFLRVRDEDLGKDYLSKINNLFIIPPIKYKITHYSIKDDYERIIDYYFISNSSSRDIEIYNRELFLIYSVTQVRNIVTKQVVKSDKQIYYNGIHKYCYNNWFDEMNRKNSIHLPIVNQLRFLEEDLSSLYTTELSKEFVGILLNIINDVKIEIHEKAYKTVLKSNFKGITLYNTFADKEELLSSLLMDFNTLIEIIDKSSSMDLFSFVKYKLSSGGEDILESQNKYSSKNIREELILPVCIADMMISDFLDSLGYSFIKTTAWNELQREYTKHVYILTDKILRRGVINSSELESMSYFGTIEKRETIPSKIMTDLINNTSRYVLIKDSITFDIVNNNKRTNHNLNDTDSGFDYYSSVTNESIFVNFSSLMILGVTDLFVSFDINVSTKSYYKSYDASPIIEYRVFNENEDLKNHIKIDDFITGFCLFLDSIGVTLENEFGSIDGARIQIYSCLDTYVIRIMNNNEFLIIGDITLTSVSENEHAFDTPF